MNAVSLALFLAAQEGGAEEHGINWWHVGPEYAERPALGLLAITFLVFVVGLVYLVRPKILTYMENRADTVKKAIDEAKRAKEAAEARAREAEQRLKNLEAETAKMRAELEQQGKAEAERMEKLAHDTAARIAKDAEDTIAAETERARLTLRAEAARLALEMAEERIKGALTANDDARLQKSLLEGLSAPEA